jgi:hypothetical protein
MAPIVDFTLSAYRKLLGDLLILGYSVKGYADADPGQSHLILRHDVDMDLGAAVSMAELEAEIGVASTYYVLMRSELYNPASPRNSAAIQRLLALGHDVGLHFDASLYDDDHAVQTNAIISEREALTALSGVKVRSFSFHRPATSLIGAPSPISDLIAAYAPRFFDEFAYVSDSRGGWHYGHPLEHEKVKRRVGLHLLTHPIWWVNNGDVPQTKLNQLVTDHTRDYQLELAANCKSYSIDG